MQCYCEVQLASELLSFARDTARGEEDPDLAGAEHHTFSALLAERRDLLPLLGAAVLTALPFVARAQQPAKIVRLGYLGFGTAAANAVRVEPLRAGLRDLGYVEGKNLVIEFRWAGTVEQLREAALNWRQ